jgi:lysophospholipase L1-like esterase
MSDLTLRLASWLSVLITPVLVLQGRRVRQVTPRLPEAEGARVGVVPGGLPAVNLLIIGESTAAGVGASNLSEALPGHLAHFLASETSRAVRWQLLGRIGVTARTARTELLAPATALRADVAVLILGVNDVLGLRRPRAWSADVEQLIQAVRERCGDIPVVLSAVPPIGRFPALPHPLRGALGVHAQLLDRAAVRLVQRLEGVLHVPMTLQPGSNVRHYFSTDGFHPSPLGYRLWAEALSRAAARAITQRRESAED